MSLIKIKAIRKKQYKGEMYNLAVEKDESYVANGIAVHNCRSLLIPITADEDYKVLWSNSKIINGKRINIQEPAKGFGAV